MPKRCAVWIDHSNAFIVKFANGGEPEVEKLESGIGAIHKSTGGARAKEPYRHGSARRHSEEERRNHQLTKFYGQIVSRIKDAPKVLLLGPGLAKQELGKAIQDLPGAHKPGYEIHPAEKMSDRQLVALVRKELNVPAPL